MMNKQEMFSGAPIFRGRWAALTWLWISGFLAGDMDLGLVWAFVPDAERPVPQTHWSIDIALALSSVFCLVMGLISLDQYGRNAWFAWAPDNVTWGDFTRIDVNRKPAISLTAWVYSWRDHVWFKND